jgi:hypothetical protein
MTYVHFSYLDNSWLAAVLHHHPAFKIPAIVMDFAFCLYNNLCFQVKNQIFEKSHQRTKEEHVPTPVTLNLSPLKPQKPSNKPF